MQWEQVNAWRMNQQFLEQRAAPDALIEVISHLNGLQAQLMSAAELQVWARMTHITRSDIQAALWQTRSLVKTWVWRGTLYIVAARDFPLYMGGRNTIQSFRRRSWNNYFKVEPDELEALMAGIRAVLTDAGMARDKLADAIAEHTGIPKFAEMLRSGWGALLKPSAAQGDICFGTNDERNVTFVNPHHWLPDWTPINAEDALLEIGRRFLNVFAPATPAEFERWFGGEARDAKRIFKTLAAQHEIIEIDIAGWRGWIPTPMQAALENTAPTATIRLLPHFDPYTLAVAKHHEYVMLPEHQQRVYRPQGWISPVVLRGGRIIGVWEYATKRDATTLTVDLFEQADATTRQGIAAEAERLGVFLGTTAQVTYEK